MNPNKLSYHRPETLKEAITTYRELQQQGEKPAYYNGGTEIVTYMRKQLSAPDAVIDIKYIPECRVHEGIDEKVIFGASLTLNEIVKENLFPLLSEVSDKIADHTVRNKLTIGGNICGRLPYREALLPFLVSDAKAVVMGDEGAREVDIFDIFHRRMKLQDGEFLVQLKVPKEVTETEYKAIRKVKSGEIDYPLLHAVCIEYPDDWEDRADIATAYSNVCPFPFHSQEVDEVLQNSSDQDTNQVISKAVEALPTKFSDDLLASGDYRQYLFELTLEEILNFKDRKMR